MAKQGFKILKTEPVATRKATGRREWVIVKGERQRELDADLRKRRDDAMTRREVKDALVKELRQLPPEDLKQLAKAASANESIFRADRSPHEEREQRVAKGEHPRDLDAELAAAGAREIEGGKAGLIIEGRDGVEQRVGSDKGRMMKAGRGNRASFDNIFDQPSFDGTRYARRR